jgi:hypothetical protein
MGSAGVGAAILNCNLRLNSAQNPATMCHFFVTKPRNKPRIDRCGLGLRQSAYHGPSLSPFFLSSFSFVGPLLADSNVGNYPIPGEVTNAETDLPKMTQNPPHTIADDPSACSIASSTCTRAPARVGISRARSSYLARPYPWLSIGRKSAASPSTTSFPEGHQFQFGCRRRG